MADFKSLIQDNDFKAYRKRQLAAIVEYIMELIQDAGNVETHNLAVALELSSIIIRLPLRLVNDEDMTDELNRQVQTDLVGIATSLVRSKLDAGGNPREE